MKGYDGHLIVSALKSEFGKVSVIPQNIEKYLSLSVGRLKFIDSFQFTSQSLDNLVNTLGDEEFKYLIDGCTTSHFDLVRRKGVYPYDYMDIIERFDEGELPALTDFYNKLNGTSCSDVDYVHAVSVWKAFWCKILGDYHDVYLQWDVLLLADFFEKFRRTCLDYYKLDPLHYLLHNAWAGVGCCTTYVPCGFGINYRRKHL